MKFKRKTTATGQIGKERRVVCLQLLIVVALVILVWSLFSLPIVSYHVNIFKVS